MIRDNKIPVGTYVKIKENLVYDSNLYGIYLNPSMNRYENQIFITSDIAWDSGHKAYYITLCSPNGIQSDVGEWIWTPEMLEFPTNEEIDKIRCQI